jgi:uncharacterized protein YjbI with pentapeptide repeats
MSDEQDLVRLKSGEQDLTYCDFIKADLSGLNLPGRGFQHSKLSSAKAIGADLRRGDFRGANLASLNAQEANLSEALFESVTLNDVNFARADLRGASFKRASLNNVNLTGTDLRGANFSAANIGEGTKFDDVLVDENTVFDNAILMRKIARHPAFRYYEFVDGQLRRKTEKVAASVQPLAPPASTPLPLYTAASTEARAATIAKIARRLEEHPVELRDMCFALALAIDEQITDVQAHKPNDGEGLKVHKRYTEFLSGLSAQLSALGAAIDSAQLEPSAASRKEKYDSGAGLLLELRECTSNWLSENLSLVVNVGFKVGLIGIGCFFLHLCGAPPMPAAIVPTLLVGGKEPAEVILAWVKSKIGATVGN